MTIDRSEVTGLVLAGGRGSRMGEVDKGLQPFGGATLVECVVGRLGPQVGQSIISANRDLERYRDFGHPVVTDATDERLGPLAGVEAALRRCSTPFLAVVPCDAPFLPDDLVARLLQAFDRPALSLAIARTATGRHPVFCVMRSSLVDDVRHRLATRRLRMQAWAEENAACDVSFDDEQAFRNLNTAADLREADRMARLAGKRR